MKEIIFQIEEYETAVQETKPLVAHITLNRPKRGNAITPVMASELMKAFEEIEKHTPPVRALVLTGAGKYFCTGMDMKQATSADSELSKSSDGDKDAPPDFQAFFAKLARLNVPTVCLLNGPALGGGVGLVFCCDIRISTSNSHYLQLSESKRGLVPALISPWIVRELNKSLVMEMMMGGGRILVSRLYSLGIFNAIVGASDQQDKYPPNTYLEKPINGFNSADDALKYYLDLIVSSAPKAVSYIKDLVLRLGVEREQNSWNGDLNFVKQMFSKMMSNEEATVGMMAFLQKQKPDWGSMSKL